MHLISDGNHNYYWATESGWDCTNEQHIWECVETGLYHFTDEEDWLGEVGYETIEECKNALSNYVRCAD